MGAPDSLTALARRSAYAGAAGSETALYSLIKNGFKLGVSDGAEELGVPVHSTRAALVDRRGVIRGYYDLTAPDTVAKLLADTSHLLREQSR